MKTVKRTMHFPKFNEKCNGFEYEKRTYERPMTKKECKADLAHTIFWWIGIMTILISLILFFVGVAGDFEILGLSALGAFVILSILIALLDRLWVERKIYPILANMENHGFEAEEFLYDQVSQEENDKAAKWRAKHPLEEAIRKAQQTKNCNDIAALLKLYQSGDLKM